jgi:hypothetical protein
MNHHKLSQASRNPDIDILIGDIVKQKHYTTVITKYQIGTQLQFNCNIEVLQSK